MKHSWLRESVDKVLAEAPHMSDAHKRKLVEALGLELARAWARGTDTLKARTGVNPYTKEKELARARFELRRSVKKKTDVIEVSPAVEPPTTLDWDSLNAYVKDRYGGKG